MELAITGIITGLAFIGFCTEDADMPWYVMAPTLIVGTAAFLGICYLLFG